MAKDADIAHWFIAIAHNDHEKAQAMRAAGISINVSHSHLPMTALMLAARMGYETMVDWLLTAGAAPSIQMGRQNQTALHLALEHNHMHCARHLLESKANPNLRDALGRTPLHYTLHTDTSTFTIEMRQQAIGLLVQHGANPDIQDIEGATPLHYSVIYGRLECIALLIAQGANPNIQTYECKLTPAHIALIEDREDMLSTLVGSGADPDIPTAQGWTVRSRLPKRWNIALGEASKDEGNAQPLFSSSPSRLRKAQKVANSSTQQ